MTILSGRGPDIFVGRGCPRPLSVIDGINPPLQDLLRGRVPYHVNPQIAAVHQRGQQAGHAALRQAEEGGKVAVLCVAVSQLVPDRAVTSPYSSLAFGGSSLSYRTERGSEPKTPAVRFLGSFGAPPPLCNSKLCAIIQVSSC